MLEAIVLPLWDLPRYEILWRCFCFLVSIKSAIIAYRLFFHPLASVPGPRLAAATSLYLRYHEVIEHGGLTRRLPHLHKLYESNIIRITPNHVHINDATAYKLAFGSNPVFRKCGDFFGSAQGVHTIVTTDDPQRHQAMRNAASPLFSSRHMDRCLLVGRDQIKRATHHMAQISQGGQPVDLMGYFQAIMINIVAGSLLCSKDLVFYDSPRSGWMSVHHFTDRYRWLLGDLPWLVPIGLKLLELFPGWISRVSVGFKDLYEHCENVGNDLLVSRKAGIDARRRLKHQTVLHLKNDVTGHLSNSDISTLFQQAAVFLLAGATPAITLTAACFYILKSEHIKTKLLVELDELDNRTPGGLSSLELDWRELARLPYLNAVVKESLRIIPPIPGLLPRVVPREGMNIGPYFIHSGTRISAAHFALHHNETVFPDPHHFYPERWLESSPDELRKMDQHFIPFSKGSRACIGSQHAYMYIFIALAHILTQFEIAAVENMPVALDWTDKTGAVPVTPFLVKLKSNDSSRRGTGG